MIQPKLHDQEAEVGVIGSLLILGEVSEKVGQLLSPGDFFDERHQRIYGAMVAMCTGLDEITVPKQMRDAGILRSGDTAWLYHCLAYTPTSLHVEYYAKIVRDYSDRRQGIKRAGEMAKAAYHGQAKRFKPIKR